MRLLFSACPLLAFGRSTLLLLGPCGPEDAKETIILKGHMNIYIVDSASLDVLNSIRTLEQVESWDFAPMFQEKSPRKRA